MLARFMNDTTLTFTKLKMRAMLRNAVIPHGTREVQYPQLAGNYTIVIQRHASRQPEASGKPGVRLLDAAALATVLLGKCTATCSGPLPQPNNDSQQRHSFAIQRLPQWYWRLQTWKYPRLRTGLPDAP